MNMTQTRYIKAAFLAIVAASISACQWTEPENLDYTRVPFEQADPEGYEAYLQGVKKYKKSSHNITLLMMDGTSDFPSSQSQRIMSMPDSADFICVNSPAGLHPEIVGEIALVEAKKETKVISHVDFSIAENLWLDLKNSRADAGQPEPTEQECKAFFKQNAEKQLALCSDLGFKGVLVSYESLNSTKEGFIARDAFMNAVNSWKLSHIDAILVLRGNIALLKDFKQVLSMCDYMVLILGGQSGTPSYIAHINAHMSQIPYKNKLLLEVTVPNADNPEQIGDSAYKAARNILSKDIQEYEPYKVLGLVVSNAADDYFNENYFAENDIKNEKPIHFGSFVNVRRAIGVFASKQN